MTSELKHRPASVSLTGASGHIGYHVAQELLRRGYALQLLIRSENENIRRLRAAGAEICNCDLHAVSEVSEALQGKSVLFHLAADNTTRTDAGGEKAVLDSTVALTRTVCEAALAAGIKTIVYTSSVVVLGRSRSRDRLVTINDVNEVPESPYVKGKLLAEQYVDAFVERSGIDLRRLYPSWVVGPQNVKETPPHRLIKDYLVKGQGFAFGGGISVTAVAAVAEAHVAALEKGKPGGKYLLGGRNVTFVEFYRALAQLSGQRAPRFNLPKWFSFVCCAAFKTCAALVWSGRSAGSSLYPNGGRELQLV